MKILNTMAIKKKEKTISQLKKKADKVFSDFIRQRDGGVCITCGKKDEWKNMQCGHYIPRDCLELRYSPKNCNTQCVGCNVFRKGNYHIYSLKLMSKYGADILHELDEVLKDYKRDGSRKYGKQFYLDIIDQYK